MINPNCTPGRFTGVAPTVTAHCGCGWSHVYPSRGQAKKGQKAHRFPDRGPELTAPTSPLTVPFTAGGAR